MQHPTRTFYCNLPKWHPSRRIQAALFAVVQVVVILGGALLWSTQAQAAPTAYSIWPTTTSPDVAADPDRSSVEVGVRFHASSEGWVTAIRRVAVDRAACPALCAGVICVTTVRRRDFRAAIPRFVEIRHVTAGARGRQRVPPT